MAARHTCAQRGNTNFGWVSIHNLWPPNIKNVHRAPCEHTVHTDSTLSHWSRLSQNLDGGVMIVIPEWPTLVDNCL